MDYWSACLAGEVPRLLRARVDPDDVLAADGFHPGVEAYRTWAEVIAAAVSVGRVTTAAPPANGA